MSMREFNSIYEGTESSFSSLVLPINEEKTSNFSFEHDYYWMVVAGCIFGFITAFGIGANDVANAFATSVGAKSLTVGQAVIIAAIFEFGGATLLGASVTDTVRKKIVDFKVFEGNGDLLIVGMLCTVLAVGIWLFVATALEMPVSTTHSVVGGIVGFALCTPAGADAVDWDKIGLIALSWVASPGLSGIIAAGIFGFVRGFILKDRRASFDKALIFFPVLVTFTVAINVFFIIYKGGKGKGWNDTPYWKGFVISFGAGIGVGLAIFFVLVPWMRKRYEHLGDEYPVDDDLEKKAELVEGKDVAGLEVPVAEAEGKQKYFNNITNMHGVIHTDEKVGQIHANAEKFSYRTERAFEILQVFTAIFDSFSHGANDVANSIGPVAAIVFLYNENGDIAKKSEVPLWILALGGAGIVVGLATYGYKIMRALGVKLVKVTPTRGFSIELGAAFVIVTGSLLGIPLSTTHCQVGATVGVGLMDGAKEAVNWPMLAKVVTGWIITLVVAGAFTAALFSFVVYSPSIIAPLSPENCLYAYGSSADVSLTNDHIALAGYAATPVGQEGNVFAFGNEQELENFQAI